MSNSNIHDFPQFRHILNLGLGLFVSSKDRECVFMKWVLLWFQVSIMCNSDQHDFPQFRHVLIWYFFISFSFVYPCIIACVVEGRWDSRPLSHLPPTTQSYFSLFHIWTIQNLYKYEVRDKECSNMAIFCDYIINIWNCYFARDKVSRTVNIQTKALSSMSSNMNCKIHCWGKTKK